jgi:hypothetical protein
MPPKKLAGIEFEVFTAAVKGCPLGYNEVWPVESQKTFRVNLPPPSLGSKLKPA